MNRCPITYELCGDTKYSLLGMRRFSRRLSVLEDFPFSADEQRKESALRASKMSVQGVQPKLSARLNLQTSCFEITDKGGRYLLKPQHEVFPGLPENEDLCMRLAATVGIEVPLHALIYCKDDSLTYVIKRFDREGRASKLATEDFAQLAGKDRNTKYDFSMEKLVPILDKCTFPVVEKVRFFRRCVFNYLIGNEDMHLKNFSLITRKNKVELAPAYDFLSSTIAYLLMGKKHDDIEEVALPLKGKKRNLTRGMWIDYFAKDRLMLNDMVIREELAKFSLALDSWRELIDKSFLSVAGKEFLVELIDQRRGVLQI